LSFYSNLRYHDVNNSTHATRPNDSQNELNNNNVHETPWKKALKLFATVITVGYIIYKMGLLRAVPDFMSNMISVGPRAISRVTEIEHIPKPGINASVHALIESPISFMTLVTFAGGLSLALGL